MTDEWHSFAYDGVGGLSGGISLDHADTWRSFSQITRGVEFADIDWNTRDPQTILGMTHEPYRTVLSVDGGKSWQKLYKDNEAGELDSYNSCRLGVINDQTLTRYNAQRGGIELSTTAGQTWTLVADYKVIARRPVHYGKNIYWNTAKGVIVTSDGEHWTLTGPGAEDACYGPYFGASEQEFVVVTSKAFLKTEDGGKTWHQLAASVQSSRHFPRQFHLLLLRLGRQTQPALFLGTRRLSLPIGDRDKVIAEHPQWVTKERRRANRRGLAMNHTALGQRRDREFYWRPAGPI